MTNIINTIFSGHSSTNSNIPSTTTSTSNSRNTETKNDFWTTSSLTKIVSNVSEGVRNIINIINGNTVPSFMDNTPPPEWRYLYSDVTIRNRTYDNLYSIQSIPLDFTIMNNDEVVKLRENNTSIDLVNETSNNKIDVDGMDDVDRKYSDDDEDIQVYS